MRCIRFSVQYFYVIFLGIAVGISLFVHYPIYIKIAGVATLFICFFALFLNCVFIKEDRLLFLDGFTLEEYFYSNIEEVLVSDASIVIQFINTEPVYAKPFVPVNSEVFLNKLRNISPDLNIIYI